MNWRGLRPAGAAARLGTRRADGARAGRERSSASHAARRRLDRTGHGMLVRPRLTEDRFSHWLKRASPVNWQFRAARLTARERSNGTRDWSKIRNYKQKGIRTWTTTRARRWPRRCRRSRSSSARARSCGWARRDIANDIQVVSTGSLGLDIALGIGGLPRGRVVEIYGPESSGKTTLTLPVIARDAEARRHRGVHRRRARARPAVRAQARRQHRASC